MGYYINPPDCSKEQFLHNHGRPVLPGAARITHDELPVCLVNNGAFTAAGIAYSAEEIEAFSRPDGRAKLWFMVSREKLKPYYKEQQS